MSRERSSSDPSKPRSRVGRIILLVALTAVAALVAAVVFSIVITWNSEGLPNVFGYSAYIVRTDAMEPTVPQGAAVLVQKCDTSTLQKGDVITFKEGYDADNELIITTQRIESIRDWGGMRVFRTLNDNLDVVVNEVECTEDAIIGKTLFSMEAVGKFVTFIKTPIGIVLCIAALLFILLIVEVINLIRVSRRPKEDPFPEDEEQPDRIDPADASAEDPAFPEEMLPAGIPAQSAYPQAFPNARSDRQAADHTRALQSQPWRTQPGDLRSRPNPSDTEAFHLEGLNVPTEISDVPLEVMGEAAVETISYEKPAVVAEPSPLDATQEFQLSAPPAQEAPPPPEPETTGEPSLPSNAPGLDFAANMDGSGQDHFVIEGIDIKVKSDALDLALPEDQRGRDISITVTRDYTNVTVGTDGNEVNFALLHDDGIDGQKVIIQRKSK